MSSELRTAWSLGNTLPASWAQVPLTGANIECAIVKGLKLSPGEELWSSPFEYI